MSSEIKESGRTDGSRVVVGVDGSSQSKLALRWAARLASALGGHIDAVAAWQYPTNWGWTPVPTDWDPRADMEKVLIQTLDEVFGADHPAGLSHRVCEGHPTTVLLEESAGAAMLVVGSRGHGGFAGMLLGSVSAAVAEHATCPVLVVHDEVNKSGESE